MKQKLRILLVNKFYYPRGGDCISMINLEALLRRMGYEVAVYAMAYPKIYPAKRPAILPLKSPSRAG